MFSPNLQIPVKDVDLAKACLRVLDGYERNKIDEQRFNEELVYISLKYCIKDLDYKPTPSAASSEVLQYLSLRSAEKADVDLKRPEIRHMAESYSQRRSRTITENISNLSWLNFMLENLPAGDEFNRKKINQIINNHLNRR